MCKFSKVNNDTTCLYECAFFKRGVCSALSTEYGCKDGKKQYCAFYKTKTQNEMDKKKAHERLQKVNPDLIAKYHPKGLDSKVKINLTIIDEYRKEHDLTEAELLEEVGLNKTTLQKCRRRMIDDENAIVYNKTALAFAQLIGDKVITR